MKIMIIIGGIGGGKTLYMTHLARKIAIENEMALYANYDVKGVKYDNSRGRVVAIDEAHFILGRYKATHQTVAYIKNLQADYLLMTAYTLNQLPKEIIKDAEVITVKKDEITNEIHAMKRLESVDIALGQQNYNALEITSAVVKKE